MIAAALRRTVASLVLMALMATIVFLGVFAIGNPIDILIDPAADDALRQQVIQRLGLDLPLHQQFLRFLAGAVQGDLGNSFVHNVPALGLILQRMPATLELAASAMALAIFLGIPLGMAAGLWEDRWQGKAILSLSILGFSLPTFWVGILLILIFAVELGLLPAGGRGDGGISHLILPACTLALLKLALVIRLARAGTREALDQDFVKFARAKGLHPARILGLHVLKNILIPIVTVLGLEFGSVIAFSVVTESVFAWPGIGKLLIDSILRLDRPVIVAYLLFVVAMFITINFIVDLLYLLLDPRVRAGERS
ncbi:MAG: ABC transporter permease [Elstera sp.]